MFYNNCIIANKTYYILCEKKPACKLHADLFESNGFKVLNPTTISKFVHDIIQYKAIRGGG